MRDPKRIDEITLALIDCWSRFPDQRLGQLIYNIHKSYCHYDMFYVEDDQWLAWINRFKNEHLNINI